jgi:hypothetical protein
VGSDDTNTKNEKERMNMTKTTHASRNDLPETMTPGYMETRSAEWNGYQISFSKTLQDIDQGLFSQLLDGLPDGMCQTPHWGYVFKGTITIKFKDREETISAGDAYYMEPGHVPILIEKGSEYLEFSPKAALDQTMAVVMKNMQKMMK